MSQEQLLFVVGAVVGLLVAGLIVVRLLSRSRVGDDQPGLPVPPPESTPFTGTETLAVETRSETEEASDEPLEAPDAAQLTAEAAEEVPEETPERSAWLGRLGSALERSRAQLRDALSSVWSGRGLDEETRAALETSLIRADLGPATASALLDELSGELGADAGLEDAIGALERIVTARLIAAEGRLNQAASGPTVTLVVGVNGAGKTTTIGKLAARMVSEGKGVLVAAGDTYRAGAIEQLRIWADRVGAEFVAQQEGSDPGAVIYGALESAQAKGTDQVLADTAGRLHTATDLMDELRKVHRVAGKVIDGAPHNVLLVLDGTVGQNGIAQARQFTEAVQVTHVAVTKLDGTAKGGALLAVAGELGLPIAFIGVGEAVDDLRPFEASGFARALFRDD